MSRWQKSCPALLSCLGLALTISFGDVYAAEGEDAQELEEIVIIGVTPLGGPGMDLGKIPSNVQSATAEDITRQQSLNLTEFLNRQFGSVFVNEAQNNPLQPDVQYRGFVASPLLGLPQGLSVYQDGVRVNEPFGETVNWALVPESAIAGIDLIPGSNPVFGLNTLGGALSIRTKNGFTHPGTRGEISGGSNDRIVAKAETGGSLGESFGYFLSGWYFDEDGWRNFSPSKAAQLFGDIGWRGVASSLDLSATYADTDLIGNGPVPVQLLDIDREEIFTRPDITENDLLMGSLRGNHQFNPAIAMDGVIYLRDSDVSTVNGDDSEFKECEDTPGFVCEEGDGVEEFALDQNGAPIPFSDSVDGAAVNRSNTEQDGYGGSFQISFLKDFGERNNRLIVGASIDSSDIEFGSRTELGSLDETRLAVPSGSFVEDSFVRVDAETASVGVFFTDTFTMSKRLALTVSGRYNDTEIELSDQLGTALSGDHNFDRFNPAAGFTYRHSEQLQLYAGYSESNRAPSPVELTCADENDPCRLPNAFLSDPPLEQVVAKSWEAGLRGSHGNLGWHLGLFHTTNEDDILFISAGALTGRGFFDNVGETRRQGAELNLSGRAFKQRLEWFVNYTYLDASFRENFFVASPNNPAAVDDEIPVQSGDRIPGIPEDLLKAGATLSITPKFQVGGDLLYSSNQFFRGDEGNLAAPVSSYTVVNVRGEYRFNEHFTLFAKIDNLFDQDYETFGLFGEADEVLGDEFDDPRFLSPASPRRGWIGVRLTR